MHMWIVTIQLGVTTVVEDRKISSADRGFSLPFFTQPYTSSTLSFIWIATG